MSATAIPKKNKDGMPDNPNQFYPTPIEFVRFANRFFLENFLTSQMAFSHPTILDAGAGTGVWGSVMREQFPDRSRPYIVGCELRTVEKPAEFDEWHQRDFIHTPLWYDNYADIVETNPPFWAINEWTLACNTGLKSGGLLWMLSPLNFLCSEARHQLLFPEWKPVEAFPIPQRMSFHGNGRTDAREYAMLLFEKGNNPSFTKVYYGEMSWYPSKVKLTLKGRQKKVKKASTVEATQLELIGADNVSVEA